MIDKCVLCGRETPYDKETPIDKRRGYIEGCGQTCPDGCDGLYDKRPDGCYNKCTAKIPDDNTGCEIFVYVKPEPPLTYPKWKLYAQLIISIAVTAAILAYIIYRLTL